jgi:hypothetical protein
LAGGITTTRVSNTALNKENMIIQRKKKPQLKKAIKPLATENKITLVKINQYSLKI